MTRTTLDSDSARRRQRERATLIAEHGHPMRTPGTPLRAGAGGMVRRTPEPMGTREHQLKKKAAERGGRRTMPEAGVRSVVRSFLQGGVGLRLVAEGERSEGRGGGLRSEERTKHPEPRAAGGAERDGGA